jgi:DNA-binding MurR/RpiR family transcriptional regulator
LTVLNHYSEAAMRPDPLPAADSVDVMRQIRARYDEMSKSQQRVAEFLLTRPVEAVSLTAARIADILEVSHSTVVRAAQFIGFDGFPELQAALQTQVYTRFNAATIIEMGTRHLVNELADDQTASTTAAIIDRVMHNDIRSIETVLSSLSMKEVESALEWLTDAPHVFILGLRSSAPMALNFGLGLRQLRPGCTIMQPTMGDLVDQAAHIAPGDVLFTLCFGRYMRDTLHMMDHARAVGARVITATDTMVSPAAKRADLVFTVQSGVWFYGASAALMSLLNALIAVLLIRQRDQANQRLEMLDSIVGRFGVFAAKPPITGEE